MSQTTPSTSSRPRIYYHVTFQPHQRLPALYSEVETYLRETLPLIAKRGEFTVVEVGVVPTHIHLLIEKAPWADLRKIIAAIKDTTSSGIFERFPELALDMHTTEFWAKGHHYVRHTTRSLATVRQYIREQKRHHGLIE